MRTRPHLLRNSAIAYFVISVFIFSVMILGPDNEYIDIPHIVLNQVTPTTIVCVLGMALVIFRMVVGKFRIDLITILLVTRVILAIIPAIYIKELPEFYGNLETTILCVIVYFIALNCIENTTKMKTAVLAMFLWIAMQVMMEAYLGPVSYFADTYYYKNNLVIPIGGSNAIASKIVPMFAYTYCVYKNKASRIMLAVILFATLGITKSRSGILAGIVILSLVMVWKENINIKKLLKFVVILLMIGIIAFLVIQNTEIGQYAFYNNSSTILNRIELLSKAFGCFVDYPVFGTSFLTQAIEYNPHNWIVSIIARGGIVGALLAFAIIILILNDLRNKYDSDVIKGSMCFVIAMLVQGLAEIILFTSTHDFLFWFMIGLAMHEANIYQEKNVKNNK